MKYIDWGIARKNYKVREILASFEELVFAAIWEGPTFTAEEELLCFISSIPERDRTPEHRRALDEYLNDKPRTILLAG